MTRASDPLWNETVADRGAEWRDLRDIPEPPELTAQCDAIRAKRAHDETPCDLCGQPRRAHGWKASVNSSGCGFKEPNA